MYRKRGTRAERKKNISRANFQEFLEINISDEYIQQRQHWTSSKNSSQHKYKESHTQAHTGQTGKNQW